MLARTALKFKLNGPVFRTRESHIIATVIHISECWIFSRQSAEPAHLSVCFIDTEPQARDCDNFGMFLIICYIGIKRRPVIKQVCQCILTKGSSICYPCTLQIPWYKTRQDSSSHSVNYTVYQSNMVWTVPWIFINIYYIAVHLHMTLN